MEKSEYFYFRMLVKGAIEKQLYTLNELINARGVYLISGV